MKLSVSLLGINDSINQLNMYYYINSVDISAIETTPNKIFIRNKEYSSLQSIFNNFNLNIFESKDNCDKAINTLNKVVELSNKYNINNLVFGSPKLRCVNNDYEYNNSIYFFKEFYNKYNRKLSIEPNAKEYGTNFLISLKDTIDYIEKNNLEDFVYINLDLGTCILNNENISNILNKNNIKYINHVHLSAPYLNSVTTQDRNYYIDAINHLNNLGYNNYVSLETLEKNLIEEIVYFKELFSLQS